jgi:hypothetical protein
MLGLSIEGVVPMNWWKDGFGFASCKYLSARPGGQHRLGLWPMIDQRLIDRLLMRRLHVKGCCWNVNYPCCWRAEEKEICACARCGPLVGSIF